MAHADFVHLRVHTAYSTAEGAIKTKDLAKRAAQMNMPAIAQTDTSTLAGIASFTKEVTAVGVQPILGLQVALDDGAAQGPLVLLAQSATGYENLTRLISNAYLATADGQAPKVSLVELERFSADVICLTGGQNGPLGRLLAADDADSSHALVGRLAEIFPSRLYVELQRLGLAGERDVEIRAIAIAEAHELPLVATNEAFFLSPDMHDAHDVLLCIAEGAYIATENRRRVSPESYLKTPAEMRSLFADLPEACDNTLLIAQRCGYAFEKSKPMLPPFPGLEGKTEAQAMREKAAEGLEARLVAGNVPAEAHATYRDRLAYELDVIERMGFPGYFLIVADFIGWAKDNGIAVGPGRGSGAGSIVAWSLRITDLDPIVYNLLFERFLNPDRVSMPDFDIDFCQERREEVIAYVKTRYGADKVAQIGTIGKLQARAAINDVGRVLQLPYPLVNRFAQMIPNNPNDPKTLPEAMELEPLASELVNADSTIKRLFQIACRLEGLHRSSSTHAAGVVIGGKPINEIVPVLRDKDGMVATQFDMKAVEDAGLVKFDFLGLKTLDVIEGARAMLKSDGIEIDFDAIGVDDKKTYALLAQAETYGVFQLESAGMRRAIKLVKPSHIEDIVALGALYRPGPMENIPTYAAVKHGEQKPYYQHPIMEGVLKDTYGIIVYQEQVMELARKLAGYSLGQADLLRRAMGKKIKAEMDAQTAVFIEGCAKNGIGENTAAEIFALVEKFASYGFNRSHAAAYGVISYRTAYLKAHYPHEFFAATMNLDLKETEKLGASVAEMRRTAVAHLRPDVNKSDVRFGVEKTANGQKAVRHALSGIRGVGQDAMLALIAERAKGGVFKSFADFVCRTAGKGLNRKAYEGLILAGACDSLHKNRNEMLKGLDRVLAGANSEVKRAASNQVSMFDLMDAPAVSDELPKQPDMSKLEKLTAEHKTLGFFLSGHPLDMAEDRLARRRSRATLAQIADINCRLGKDIVAGAIVMDMRVVITKKTGEPMAILTLSDPTTVTEGVFFPEDFAKVRSQLKVGGVYVLTGSVSDKDGERRFILRDLEPLELGTQRPDIAA